jgi:type I restriction enzyme, S subunit
MSQQIEQGPVQQGASRLPTGWCWTTVDHVMARCQYGSSAKANGDSAGVPVLRMGNIQDGRLDLTDLKYLPAEHEEFPKLLLRDGDLLFNRTNSAELVGKSAVYTGLPSPCSYASYLVGLRLGPNCDSKYLCFYLNSHYGRHWVRSVVSQQVGQANVNSTKLRALQFPLAPLNEQRRIVAKIEELFSDLDAAVAALVRVRTKLKRYHRSVLKAAIEGKLTAKWRSRHPQTEPATSLLDRILNERRRRWDEVQRARFAEARTQPPKNWHAKYQEPVSPDATALPTLPPGWCWATVDQITENFDGRRVPVKAKDRALRQGDYPYYGASGIIDSVDDFLFDGHYLLIAEDGANLLSRSTPIAFEATGRFWVNNHAHIVQTYGSIPLAHLRHVLNGTRLDFFITGTAQPKLTQAALNRICLPLPPLEEQIVIVQEVEDRLSVVDQLALQVEANMKRAARLKQGILKRAFEGRLVSQDPTDEPSNELLERLRLAPTTATNDTSGGHASQERHTRQPRRLLPDAEEA